MRKFLHIYIPASLFLFFLATTLVACGGGGGGGGGDAGGGSAATLTDLTINGPSSVNESSTAMYTAMACWNDGSTSSCTPSWAVAPKTYASISASGELTTLPVPSDQKVFVSAAYVHEGITKTNTIEVTILDMPGPAATTLSASSVSYTGATLSGSVNPNGLATNAWFEWGTDAALANFSTTPAQQAGSGTTSQAITHALSGLSQGTTYYFRVAASNSAGESKGQIRNFTTMGAPPTVSTSAATSISSNGATLNGSVNPNGLATNAWFEWGTSPTLSSYTETAPQSLGSGTTNRAITHALSGLSQGTTYYFRVAASNSAGERKGTIVNFATTSPPLSFGVVSTSPANDETEISVDGKISVTFNQDVDPATLVDGGSVRSFLGDLPGTISYDPSSKTATFTPGTPFAPLTVYTVTIATTVKSASGEPLPTPYIFRFTTVTAFWVKDRTLDEYYLMNVSKVAEGTHCYIYLEDGETVSQTDIDRIVSEFDGTIYPSVHESFGSEPNPGADGLPKIFIVLLDIRDGNDPESFIAGMFVPIDMLSNVIAFPAGDRSNQKEVFYMDTFPGDPTVPKFERTLVHEFQHMVHVNQRGADLEELWLNEAMSTVAPFYAGYGPDYLRVLGFELENNRKDSLTYWNSTPEDYYVVYMWAQYMADRFPSDVFKKILASPGTGMTAPVEDYLSANYPGETFATVFRDWSIAVWSGNLFNWTDHPEWTYKSINTWDGTYPYPGIPGKTITLYSLFNSSSNNVDTSLIPSLAPWSVDFYYYTPQSADPTFTFTLGPPPTPQGSIILNRNNIRYLYFNITPGYQYSYDTYAFLILQNTSLDTTSSSNTTNLSIQSVAPTISVEPIILPPMEKLKAFSKSSTVKRLRERTGEPMPVCIHDYLLQEAKALRDRIKEKRNAP